MDLTPKATPPASPPEDAMDWDFSAAREYLKGLSFDLGDNNTPSRSGSLSRDPKTLGDLGRAFNFLGCSEPSLALALYKEFQLASSNSYLPSPPSSPKSLRNSDTFESFVGAIRGVSFERDDESIRNDHTAEGHRKTAADAEEAVQLLSDEQLVVSQPNVELQVQSTPTRSRSVPPGSTLALSNLTLLPSTLPPRPHLFLPIPIPLIDPSVIQPLYHRTLNEQKAALVRKIRERLPEPNLLGESDRHAELRIIHGVTSGDNSGLHIFVDFSNILIGFYDRLKLNRNLDARQHQSRPPFSFESLVMVLERGRRVVRRILTGSASRNSQARTDGRNGLTHFANVQRCGYELCVLERVLKPLSSKRVRKARAGVGFGYATASGQESGSEGPLTGRVVVTEQCVDELLQMKMLESLVDQDKPSTMVLASGDAAEAEFSGGFLKTVERALKKGWIVEVVAWREGMSGAYRTLLQRYGRRRLKLIELDEFCEEMLAIYVDH